MVGSARRWWSAHWWWSHDWSHWRRERIREGRTFFLIGFSVLVLLQSRQEEIQQAKSRWETEKDENELSYL
jgi:hypothetical protein